jgi:amino acid adenylation domain-containing protein
MYPITLPLIKVKPNNLAYVIYTSGSTGNPKGVMIEHSNVVSFFENFASHFLSPMYQRVGATTNFTFDISVLELLGNLCEGKEIYLFDQLEVSDPDQLIEKVIQDKLDFLQLTPSRLRQAMEVSTKFLGQLKVMLIGGEELKKELKERVLAENKDIKLINVYGPTETTVWSSCSLQKQGKEVTIGKALKEEQLYILSDNLRIQPYGVIGELCISGAGVARGYHNRPDLTAEKFISHPFINGEKLYKTGDLVKKLYNENIAFIGRKDKQVKLRGYRIELGEIEQILLKESCVQEVVVEVKSIQEEQVLVAYIVSDQELDKQKLRDTLQRKLPEYMLPNYFVALKGIPLTSSGKLDRLSLPTVGDKDIIKKTYVGPRNEIEETLVSLWQEVLGIEKIGVTDNFFELGGHSLSGTRLLGLIHRELNVKISINMLFENMVLEEQSTLIESIQIINKNTISEENEGVFENFTI